jgi:hypothetical protein
LVVVINIVDVSCEAQAMMDKSLAERNLYAVMGGGEEKKAGDLVTRSSMHVG